MKADLKRGHLIIERVDPEIDCGRFRAKAVVGDEVTVTADILRDGADLLQATIRYRGPDDARWQESPMRHLENDRWIGTFQPSQLGRWRYTIEAWTDHYGTWARDLRKKVDAGVDVELELEEGVLLMEARLRSIPTADRPVVADAIEKVRTAPPSKTDTRKRQPAETTPRDDRPTAAPDDPRVVAALDARVIEVMAANPDRRGGSTYKPVLELTADRERARFGSWYEFFPRSTGAKKGEHGNFKTAIKALPRIADMGFDVAYLPPIHPIGRTHRKGKNNTLEPREDDVGVPWAIGSPEGGHRDIHPQLGSIEDFDRFVAEASKLGLEVALDFAIQCSPDHPWVKEHPQWFKHRPDGTIKYAENPPKKYQDIYPIDFDTDDREGLWTELRSVLDHWISHGVKIFRVDNPHTKAFPFWDWVINTIQEEHPEVIFLAEAFTRPKVMQQLAKLGFTQSYTYFTWRNNKYEMTEYMEELTRTEMAHYFRPNFFANTPDILHEYLQTGGPPAFKIRLVLASMLSPTYGLYSGYELCENVALKEGSEEYLDSEKYELKWRDWTRPGNLGPYITRVNEIRRKNPSLAEFTNLHFHPTDKDAVMAFSKRSPGHDPILVIVSFNPFHWEEATVDLDLGALGLSHDRPFEVQDLITDTTYVWNGPWNYVRLDPQVEPAHIFRVRG